MFVFKREIAKDSLELIIDTLFFSMKSHLSLFLSLGLTVALTAGAVGQVFAKEFSDVPREHASTVAISTLSEEGVISGRPDGSYGPEEVVNRAAALKLILIGAGISLEENISESGFSDVPLDQWYVPYVVTAARIGVVNGNPDGSFTPAAPVKRAAFMKMLLEANRFKSDKWQSTSLYKDVPADAWYAAYMNYAGQSGLISPDQQGNLYPDSDLTRAEVADIMYLLRIILKGNDAQYLLSQSEQQMAQIEVYVGKNMIPQAKRAAELAVDMTQQAMKNVPENNVVLGAAKIAKAYSLLVEGFIAGIQKDSEQARSLLEQSKIKAGEAYDVNPDTQPIGKHVKTRVDEIIGQLP